MGINGIAKILKTMSRSEKGINQQVVELCGHLAKNSKRVVSPRITFRGAELETLPTYFRELTSGLKNPRITLGYNAGKGQSTLGMAIADGGRPVGGVAFSMDTTRGAKPIFQQRYRFQTADAAAEHVMSGGITLNPNSVADDFIHSVSKRNGVLQVEHLEDGVHFTQIFNPSAAERVGLEMPTVEEFTQGANGIGEKLKVLKIRTLELATPKKPVKRAKTVKPPKTSVAAPKPVSFVEDVKQIIAFEGATSVESANKAKDLLMKRMGYDPKLITIKGKDFTNLIGQAYFNPIGGEIIVNEAMAGRATHFDVADVLLHELKHMDDHVKLCKYMGIDKYEKLMLELKKSADAKDVVFNRAFYEKAIQQADITGFNAKPILKEIKDTIRINSSNLSYEYAKFIDSYRYATSPLEINARRAEITLVKELKAGGVQITHTLPSLKDYGKTPSSHLIEIMPKIESKLGKYPLNQRNDIFNKAHDAALAELEPEFARLLKKLKTEGLTVGTPEQIRFHELNEKLCGKDFDQNLLNRILELL